MSKLTLKDLYEFSISSSASFRSHADNARTSSAQVCLPEDLIDRFSRLDTGGQREGKEKMTYKPDEYHGGRVGEAGSSSNDPIREERIPNTIDSRIEDRMARRVFRGPSPSSPDFQFCKLLVELPSELKMEILSRSISDPLIACNTIFSYSQTHKIAEDFLSLLWQTILKLVGVPTQDGTPTKKEDAISAFCKYRNRRVCVPILPVGTFALLMQQEKARYMFEFLDILTIDLSKYLTKYLEMEYRALNYSFFYTACYNMLNSCPECGSGSPAGRTRYLLSSCPECRVGGFQVVNNKYPYLCALALSYIRFIHYHPHTTSDRKCKAIKLISGIFGLVPYLYRPLSDMDADYGEQPLNLRNEEEVRRFVDSLPL